MYSVTSAMGAKLMTLTLSGKVSGREYTEIRRLLRQALENHQTVDLLCELDGFRGIGIAAMWRAARVATENDTNLRRVAVVGERERYKWARALVRAFHAETRYFQPTHRAQALRWLTATNPRVAASSGGLLGDASYRNVIIQRDEKRNKTTKRKR